MTSRTPAYALQYIIWETATKFVPFAASAPTDYAPRTMISSEQLNATTARGAERVTRAKFRDDPACIVAVYYSEQGRSVYVVTKIGRQYLCETFQPVHHSYAVYWDAETVAKGLAAMGSVGKKYPVIARPFA